MGESTEPTKGVMKHTYKLYYTIIAWCNTAVSYPINLCTEKGAIQSMGKGIQIHEFQFNQ
jgi:hypothetical protein